MAESKRIAVNGARMFFRSQTWTKIEIELLLYHVKDILTTTMTHLRGRILMKNEKILESRVARGDIRQ